MRQACNLSTREVEAGGLVVQGLPLLHEEFVASPQSRLHEPCPNPKWIEWWRMEEGKESLEKEKTEKNPQGVSFKHWYW